MIDCLQNAETLLSKDNECKLVLEDKDFPRKMHCQQSQLTIMVPSFAGSSTSKLWMDCVKIPVLDGR